MLKRNSIKNGQKRKTKVNSSKKFYDGIEFDSGLEVYCYRQLKDVGLTFEYTKTTFVLINGFIFNGVSFEPDKKRGLLLTKKSPNLQSIKYTPDFVGNGWIIETKGRANESFGMRYKLFKKYLTDNNFKYDLYLPKNQKQVDQCIELIQSNK